MRFTFRQLFTRDFVADTFNFDRGFLYTCKSMFYRPGRAVSDYLRGKRKEYFNFIGFLLILLGVEAILWQLSVNSPSEVMMEVLNNQLKESKLGDKITMNLSDVETVMRNQKFLFIPAIPLAALIPFFVLRRLKLNFLEHCIAVCFLLAMNTLLGISIGLVGLLPISYETYKMIYLPVSAVVFFFDILLFWQLTKPAGYSVFGRIWRTLVSGIAAVMVVAFTQQIAMGIVTARRNDMESQEAVRIEQLADPPAPETSAPEN